MMQSFGRAGFAAILCAALALAGCNRGEPLFVGPVPTPSPASGAFNLYATNLVNNGISFPVFANGSNGNVSPLRAFTPSAGLGYTGFGGLGTAFDPLGQAYVKSNGAIAIFPAFASGNVPAVGSIASVAIAGGGTPVFDGSGNLYVPDSNSATSTVPAGSVDVFPPSVVGNASPIRSISGSNAQLFVPVAVALDTQGFLYVGDLGIPALVPAHVNVYAPLASGNVAPVRTLQGQNVGITGSTIDLALDASGNLYVAGNGVAVFPRNASGSTAPSFVVVPPGGTNVTSVAVDASGNLYAATPIAIYVYAPLSYALPARTITGPNTGLVQATTIRLGP